MLMMFMLTIANISVVKLNTFYVVTYFTMTYDIKILYCGIPNYQGSLNFHHTIIILTYMCNKIKIDV